MIYIRRIKTIRKSFGPKNDSHDYRDIERKLQGYFGEINPLLSETISRSFSRIFMKIAENKLHDIEQIILLK